MKKSFLVLSSLCVSLLMISTVSAVPNSQSQPIMDFIDHVEQEREKFDNLSDQAPTGILNLILQIILALYYLIMNFFTVVKLVIGIFRNIKSLIESIKIFLQQLQDFLDILSNLLNPEGCLV